MTKHDHDVILARWRREDEARRKRVLVAIDNRRYRRENFGR